MNQTHDYDLLDLEFANGKKKLKLVLTYFNDSPKLDLREYYFDETSSEFRHTKKGVQLDYEKAEALRNALEVNSEIINSHMLSKKSNQKLLNIKTISSSAGSFPINEFFKTESRGSEEKVIFNINHPAGKKFIDLDQKSNRDNDFLELLHLLKLLLVSYDHAISQFDEQSKTTVGDFVSHHARTWSAMLKRLSNASL